MLTEDLEPRPVFAGPDSLGLSDEQFSARYPCVVEYLRRFPPSIDAQNDARWGRLFLARHSRIDGTFNSYRTVVERLLLWSWIIAGKSALTLNRNDFGQLCSFCQKPPEKWIRAGRVVRFVDTDAGWIQNERWRPFDATGQPDSQDCKPFTGTLRQVQSISSSFYNFLHAEDAVAVNPVVMSRSKNGRELKTAILSRQTLNAKQASQVIASLERLAVNDPSQERALFIVAATFFMLLRGTDLAQTGSYYPRMNCFVRENGEWWFIIDRPDAPPEKLWVPPHFLPYLERYRVSRGLPPLPGCDEDVPILENQRRGSGVCERHIREIVRNALKDVHAEIIEREGYSSDWNVLASSSLRFIKHSGARVAAQTCSPLELQRGLRSDSLPHTYARYFSD